MTETFYFPTSPAAWDFFRECDADPALCPGYPSLTPCDKGFAVRVLRRPAR